MCFNQLNLLLIIWSFKNVLPLPKKSIKAKIFRLFPNMNKFLLLSLLSIIHFAAEAHEDIILSGECPACRMPCEVSNNSSALSLIRVYSTSYNDYRITTLLNGIQGYFRTTVSLNDKVQDAYFARVNLEYWPFNALCKILSQAPTITKSKNKKKLNLHYKTFPSFNVHLKQRFFDNYLQHFLIERVSRLQNNIPFELEYLKKVSVDHLKKAFRNANVTGVYFCYNPNPIRNPSGLHECGSNTGTWMQIDMKEVYIINYIGVHLWDGQSGRIYTYTLQVSEDGKNWKDIAVNKVGKSYQGLELPEIMSVRYIRMDGNNNIHANTFHILYLKVELK